MVLDFSELPLHHLDHCVCYENRDIKSSALKPHKEYSRSSSMIEKERLAFRYRMKRSKKSLAVVRSGLMRRHFISFKLGLCCSSLVMYQLCLMKTLDPLSKIYDIHVAWLCPREQSQALYLSTRVLAAEWRLALPTSLATFFTVAHSFTYCSLLHSDLKSVESACHGFILLL